MEKTKKNAKTILITLALAVIAIVGLTTAFLVNYNTYSPEKPVVLDDGSNVYISTSLNDNYAGYRFKFEGEEGEIFVDSKENVISSLLAVEKGVKLGEKYQVSTCYVSQNEGNNSQYSDKIEWTCEAYLQKTVVAYNAEECKLVWQAIDKADYYRVFFNDKEGEGYLQTQQTELSLKEFEGGEMVAYVISFSNDKNYKTSAKSNMLEFEHKHFFSPFSTLTFDKETCVLTAHNAELLDKLEITLFDADYDAENNPTAKTVYPNVKFDVTKEGEAFVYKIDLTTVYNGEVMLGINPATVDTYNLYNGTTTILDINA